MTVEVVTAIGQYIVIPICFAGVVVFFLHNLFKD